MKQMLDSKTMQYNDPAWLKAAFKEVGTTEIKGAVHESRILEYHACTGLGAGDDETPWCASFVCFVMESCNLTSTKSAASLSYLRWGRELARPVRGCVVIFERVDRNGAVIPNRGHVGFWLGESDGFVEVLGGNQSNKVNVSNYGASRVIGYRWPSMPHNSTSNIASTGIGVSTVVAAVPSVLGIIKTIGASEGDVVQAMSTAQTVADGVGIPMVNLISVIGMVGALAGVAYLIHERNTKIKKFGI